MSTPPLLVTLQMDAASHAHFDALRQRYFPPERNHLAAHITLFHKLPGEEFAAVRAILAEHAARQSAFDMRTTSIWMLGLGNAYLLEAPEAVALRKSLAEDFSAWLTPQDARQGFKPHITVQNKVASDKAKALNQLLTESFTAQCVRATGLQLWRYMNGPWEWVEDFALNPAEIGR
ncbi:MAG: phosphoesterase HXTX [Rickettsiales bacterium]|nr:phosphoesterase HXTX [Rickettsiales bacterium]|tara:strand:- start:336 stop:863 length:528 start_codon:yes stop_codon:yes gene_type:complete